MLPDYITLVELFGAPTGFRSPYCWLTTNHDSQFTTGALRWARRAQNVKAAGRRPTLVSREGLEPSASTFAEWRPIRWAIASLAAGIRFERTPLAVNSRLPYRWATLLCWSRWLGLNQRPPRSKRGMLPLHHT
jgi:hypothetical protein